MREDPEELLFRPGPVASCSQPACPLLLSRCLSQPLVSRGVVTAACPVTDLKRAALSTGEWRAASHLPLRSIGVCVVEVCVCVGGHIGQWALVHLSSQDKSQGGLLSVAAGSGAVRVWYPCASEAAGLPLGHPCPWTSEGGSGVPPVALAPFACAVFFFVCL